MPGQVMYKESIAHIHRIKSQYPEVFEDRHLYLQTHKMMATYSFSLTMRRTVLGLFTQAAKCRSKSSLIAKANLHTML
jgi:hypothetical protein